MIMSYPLDLNGEGNFGMLYDTIVLLLYSMCFKKIDLQIESYVL